MKLLNLVPVLALFFIFGACNDRTGTAENETVVTEEEMEDPDAVFTAWNDAWNSGSAEEILNMTADDAVLVMNGTEVSRDSISAWINESSAVMQDLELNAIQKNNFNNVAYETGNFDHGLKENDTLRFAGTYTFIYEKPEGENQWKVKVMNITDRVEEEEMPDM